MSDLNNIQPTDEASDDTPVEGTTLDGETAAPDGQVNGGQTQQAAKEHAAAQMQLRQLPPGTVIAPGIVIGENGQPQRAPAPGAPGAAAGRPEDPDHGPGQYL